MCEPTTIMMGVGLALGAVGTYQQAQTSKNLSSYNVATSENNAKLSEFAAQDALKRGDEEANAIRRNADMLKGSQRSSMAARGLDLAEGTAAELQDQTDFFAMADVATARNNAKREAWGYRTQGTNYSSEAAKNRAVASSINPMLSATTSLLTNGGTVADRWYKK